MAVAIFSLYSVHLLLKTANEGGESVCRLMRPNLSADSLSFLLNPASPFRRCARVRAARLQSLRDAGQTGRFLLHHHAEHWR